MSLPVRLHSTQPPERVLVAIRDHAATWRDAAIPRDLRRLGVQRVETRVRESDFMLSVRSLTDVSDHIVLRGTVSADGAGGTWVDGRCGPRWKAAHAAGLLVFPAIAFLVSGSPAVGMVLLGMSALGAIGDRFTERRVGRGEHEIARLLIGQLRHALAILGPAVEGKRLRALDPVRSNR